MLRQLSLLLIAATGVYAVAIDTPEDSLAQTEWGKDVGLRKGPNSRDQGADVQLAQTDDKYRMMGKGPGGINDEAANEFAQRVKFPYRGEQPNNPLRFRR